MGSNPITRFVSADHLEAAVRTIMRAVLVVGGLALAAISAGQVTAVATSQPIDPHAASARAALEAMTQTERAGQVIMTSVPGVMLRSKDARTLRMLKPGGVILFASNVRSDARLRGLTRSLQRALSGAGTRPGGLVSIDQEGGVVKRIAALPPTRSHPQLGAADRVALTRAQSRATARALRARGINMNLAPVADLDLGPRHVMAQRSFGANARLVSRHVAAFVRGSEQAGVAASVKHFPGFGGASVNSDDALAIIRRSRARLLAQDLAPFRAAVAAHADSIMMSHGVYRALDRRRPASTSEAAYRLLRTTLGYDGVVITDSLHAAGFTAATRGSVAAGCAATISAGADIALLTGSLADAMRCRARILSALDDGSLEQHPLDEAVVRVLELKARLGLLEATPPAAIRLGFRSTSDR